MRIRALPVARAVFGCFAFAFARSIGLLHVGSVRALGLATTRFLEVVAKGRFETVDGLERIGFVWRLGDVLEHRFGGIELCSAEVLLEGIHKAGPSERCREIELHAPAVILPHDEELTQMASDPRDVEALTDAFRVEGQRVAERHFDRDPMSVVAFLRFDIDHPMRERSRWEGEREGGCCAQTQCVECVGDQRLILRDGIRNHRCAVVGFESGEPLVNGSHRCR